jgi:tol-pal system-associated acyl-CoA thioesterase
MIELKFRIYLEDTDAGGIVYHANYLRFMERARTELLRAAGLEQSATFTEDVSFVVHTMKLQFHSPARLDDIVIVTADVSATRGASFVVAQEVRAESGSVHCSAEVSVACIRLSDQKPRRIPEQLLNSLKQGNERPQ